jgi:hypothetical protein
MAVPETRRCEGRVMGSGIGTPLPPAPALGSTGALRPVWVLGTAGQGAPTLTTTQPELRRRGTGGKTAPKWSLHPHCRMTVAQC